MLIIHIKGTLDIWTNQVCITRWEAMMARFGKQAVFERYDYNSRWILFKTSLKGVCLEVTLCSYATWNWWETVGARLHTWRISHDQRGPTSKWTWRHPAEQQGDSESAENSPQKMAAWLATKICSLSKISTKNGRAIFAPDLIDAIK